MVKKRGFPKGENALGVLERVDVSPQKDGCRRPIKCRVAAYDSNAVHESKTHLAS